MDAKEVATMEDAGLKLRVGDVLDGGLLANASSVAAVVHAANVHVALEDLSVEADRAWPATAKDRSDDYLKRRAPGDDENADRVEAVRAFAGARGVARQRVEKCRAAVDAWCLASRPPAPVATPDAAVASGVAAIALGALAWRERLDRAAALLDGVLAAAEEARSLKPAFSGNARAPFAAGQAYYDAFAPAAPKIVVLSASTAADAPPRRWNATRDRPRRYATLQRTIVDCRRLERLGVFEAPSKRKTASEKVVDELALATERLADVRDRVDAWFASQRKTCPLLHWLDDAELVRGCAAWSTFAAPGGKDGAASALARTKFFPGISALSVARPKVVDAALPDDAVGAQGEEAVRRSLRRRSSAGVGLAARGFGFVFFPDARVPRPRPRASAATSRLRGIFPRPRLRLDPLSRRRPPRARPSRRPCGARASSRQTSRSTSNSRSRWR